MAVLYFGSGTKARELSNFWHCDVLLTRANVTPALRRVCPAIDDFLGANGRHFASTEHAWQALKARDEATFLRFCTDGDLGRWDPAFFAKTTKKGKAADMVVKGMKHWQTKNCIGIIAKVAVNPTYARALGLDLGRLAYDREHLSPEDERDIWLTLLRAKFTQNPALRLKLLGTGQARLVEFARGAARPDAHEHWGGYVRPDGTLSGDNVMGQYVQHVREELAAQ